MKGVDWELLSLCVIMGITVVVPVSMLVAVNVMLWRTVMGMP